MELLKDFIQTVKENDLGVYGIHIYQKRKTLVDYRFRSNDRENLYSASKSFVSVGIGIAESEGLIKLTYNVLDYFTEYKSIATPDSNTITIYNLLQMSSGHSPEEFAQYNKRDRAELFFMTPLENEAGSTFYYEDLSSYILGRIIEKVSGDMLLEYLKPRLFAKLDIINPQWHTCQLGHTACSGVLYLTTEEFSRLGITLLQNGMYKQKQIVPSDYVKRMYSNWIDTKSKNHPETQGGYGFQIWNCTIKNTFRADGMYGQMYTVLMDYNVVVTVTAHNEDNHKDILCAIWDNILAKIDNNK